MKWFHISLLVYTAFWHCDARVSSPSSITQSSYANPSSKEREHCVVGTDTCGALEECKPINGHSRSNQGICECKDGYRRSSDGQCERVDEKADADGAYCEFGIDFCGENEVCKPRNKRSKSGTCVCVDGYKRNKARGCELEANNATAARVEPTTPSYVHSDLIADAGPDLTVTSPDALVVIDAGARSRGDIKKYIWRRTDSSLASGRILNGSDEQPILLFLPRITGVYEFVVTIQSTSGATAHDSVKVTVQDIVGRHAIVMRLAGAAYRFSEADRHGLATQIELLLAKPSSVAKVRPLVSISSLIDQTADSSLLVEFDVHFELLEGGSQSSLADVKNAVWINAATEASMPTGKASGTSTVYFGDPRWIVDYLETILEEQRYRLLDFEVLHVGPKYCIDRQAQNHNSAGAGTNVTTTTNRCGAHAVCIDERKCVCESLWLSNPSHRLRSHCDLSLLAVVFVPLGMVVLLAGIVFACIRLCCGRRLSLEERVNLRLARRDRDRRETKRLIVEEGPRKKAASNNKNESMNNLFDSDDNYDAGVDTDEEFTGSGRRGRGTRTSGAINKLTSDADGDLHDAEVTAFVNDNVNVNVRSGMNLNSEKIDRAKA